MADKYYGKPQGKTKQLMSASDFHTKKKWGQNFLLEPKFVGKIIYAADLDKYQIVLEIGQGLVALTKK